MKTVVIMPGGFHPFHAGHYALYQQAKKAFPGAEVYVAATDDRSTRPFPFEIKEKLAKLAGVDAGHFVRVTSPFQAKEITANFDPNQDRVIFVRSEKDANEPPRPGGVKKDGSPSYLQPYTGRDMEPFGRHAYMAYLPTVEFGPGLTSATQIRAAWPGLNDRRKTALVMSLYPKTQGNPKLAATVVKMLDTVIAGQVNEISFFKVKAPVQDQPKDTKPKLGYQHLFKPKQQPAPQPKVYQGWDEYKKEKEDPDYIEEKCWDTHRQAGMKKKGDRMVPNCVPKESTEPLDEGLLKNLALAGAIGLGSLGYGGTAQAQDTQMDQPTAVQQVQKIDYTKPGPVTKDSMGQKLEYGVPVTDQGKFKAPNKNLPADEYEAQARAYKQWRADFTARWPSAQFAPDGSVTSNIRPGLAAPNIGGFAKMNEADFIKEKWSEKYKRSINCANPKGFSQRAHCQGRKK